MASRLLLNRHCLHQWTHGLAGSWAELELDTQAQVDQGDTLIWLSHLRR